MNVDQFLNRIVFMAQNFGDYDINHIIKTCLMDIGVPTDLDGFKYLVSSVVFLHENPGAMVTKHIYPAVAKEFGCHDMHVEVSIRRAIYAAWKSRDLKWFNYFSDDRKPTNSEFINGVGQVLDFWDACRKNKIIEGAGECE